MNMAKISEVNIREVILYELLYIDL